MKRIINFFFALWWALLPAGAQTAREAEAVFNQGEDAFWEQGDYEKAYGYYLKALDLTERCQATRSLLYYWILTQLADVSEKRGDYYAAFRYMERAIAVDNDTVQNSIKEDMGPSSDLRLLSDYYGKAGLWDKAFKLKKQRIEKKLQKALQTGVSLSKVGFEQAFGDFLYWIESAEDYKYALRILKRAPKEPLLEPFFDYWFAKCYSRLGKSEKELEYYQASKSGYDRVKTLVAEGRYPEALVLQEQIVEKEKEDRKRKIHIGHEPYWGYLSVLAEIYILVGQYDKAIECEKQNRPSVTSYLNISRAYSGKQQWDSARVYVQKALQLNPQERNKTSVLAELARCSFAVGDRQTLQKDISELLRCAGHELASSLRELTYNERSRYIESYTDILTRQIPFYAYHEPSDTLTEAAYNAVLMTKGALLTSENIVKKVIEESNDDALEDLWDELKTDRTVLSKELEKDVQSRRLNVDSLQARIDNLEDLLIVRCKSVGDITRNMKLTWSDIRQHLHSDDIAIEILSFPVGTDSVVYAALSLRKNSESPKLTKLFYEKQLKQVPDTLSYLCPEMTDLVWRPLMPELKGVRNIYFSPAAALYNIGIEYLPGMEEYNIYRLSSTRELVIGEKVVADNNAVLFGGLDYNAAFCPQLAGDRYKEHAYLRDLALRGAQGALPQTKVEVEQIRLEMDKARWNCELLTDGDGTEESFKSLSGRKLRTLHLSTHGFYYTADEADHFSYSFFQIDHPFVSAEDRMLNRSGLILSGANHILEDEVLPDNVEDGILTAREIADVDLHGLDLVVLSACRTGLGDLSQSEGVFGLQRGFKKAGANTILMSLWKVDDRATQILMTHFYHSLLAGKSKYEALQSAQKRLRKVEKGKYASPKYWAAFIMLDGINKF